MSSHMSHISFLPLINKITPWFTADIEAICVVQNKMMLINKSYSTYFTNYRSRMHPVNVKLKLRRSYNTLYPTMWTGIPFTGGPTLAPALQWLVVQTANIYQCCT